MLRKLTSLVALSSLLLPITSWADAIRDAVNHSARSSEDRLRDEYRNPQQTLRFFGVEPEMTVVEILPGGGWYTDILAPLLQEKGTLYAAHFLLGPDSRSYYVKSRKGFEERVASHPPYQKVKLTSFDVVKPVEIAPAASADMVLTFRNVHNWYMREGDKGLQTAFTAFYKALKKGGTLGVVEHQLPEALPDVMQEKSGYMKRSKVLQAAQLAGFKLVAESKVNANPLDSASHPKGVWTLPPRLAAPEGEEAKYLAIGESNRMTLKFIKP